MSEELAEIWSGVQEKGWLNISATHALESLFMTAGPQWFVISLVKVYGKFLLISILTEETNTNSRIIIH